MPPANNVNTSVILTTGNERVSAVPALSTAGFIWMGLFDPAPRCSRSFNIWLIKLIF
jgi:hypothetical protein